MYPAANSRDHRDHQNFCVGNRTLCELMTALHPHPPPQHNTHMHRNLHTTEGGIIPLNPIYDLRVCVPQVANTLSNLIYSFYRSGNLDLERDVTCPRLHSGFEAPPALLSLPCWLGEPIWEGY